MPKVPTIQNQVQDTRLPNVRAKNALPQYQDPKAAEFSKSLVDHAIKFEAEEVKQANEAAAFNFEQKILKKNQEILYNSDYGLLNKKGEKSLNIDSEYQENISKFMTDLEKEAANDVQVRAIRSSGLDISNKSYKSIHNHIVKESDNLDKEITKNYLQVYRDNAVLNFNDMEIVGESIQKQRNAVAAKGKRFGLTPDVIARNQNEVESVTHLGVITRYLDSGGFQQGEDYFKTIKDKLTADDLSKATRMVEDSVLRGKAQQTVDINFSQTSNYNVLLDKARGIEEPKLRDEVLRRTKLRIADDKMVKQRQREDNFEVAYRVLNETKNIDMIPASIMQNLNPSDHQKLLELSTMGNVKTDFPTYYRLEKMASNPQTRDQFKNLNLISYMDKLSPSDRAKVSKWQNDLRSGKGDSEKLLDGIETKSSIVNGYLRSAGIDTSSKADKEDMEKEVKFRRELDKLIVEKKEASGNREITNEEVRKLADSLMVEAVKDTAWFSDNSKKTFEAEVSDFSIEDVPEEREKVLTFKFQQKFNKKPTEQELLEMHLFLIKRGM